MGSLAIWPGHWLCLVLYLDGKIYGSYFELADQPPGVDPCLFLLVSNVRVGRARPGIFDTLPTEVFPLSVEMAANQGLYNGFLAAGLFWSLTIRDQIWQRKVAILFLIFVAIAGVYGTYSVTIKALIAQTMPAVLAMATIYFSGRGRA